MKTYKNLYEKLASDENYHEAVRNACRHKGGKGRKARKARYIRSREEERKPFVSFRQMKRQVGRYDRLEAA